MHKLQVPGNLDPSLIVEFAKGLSSYRGTTYKKSAGFFLFKNVLVVLLFPLGVKWFK